MKGDLHPVALNLSSSLSVRRHYAKPQREVQPPTKEHQEPVGRVPKRVEADGVRYSSVLVAAGMLGVSRKTVERWLKNGRARYL